jgi:hypothetical protein
MSQQNNNQSPLVGYCETPRLESRFSLTVSELEDLKRYATEGKNGKEGRVYLTAVSGMSKAGKAYNMIKVYDPNANTSGQTHKPAAAPQAGGDDLPF